MFPNASRNTQKLMYKDTPVEKSKASENNIKFKYPIKNNIKQKPKFPYKNQITLSNMANKQLPSIRNMVSIGFVIDTRFRIKLIIQLPIGLVAKRCQTKSTMCMKSERRRASRKYLICKFVKS